jgi:hypothetical protein
MFQDKRPSLPLTFVKRMRLLALICFKLEGTSGLTGSRGHRGHTMCHEERPSLTFTFGKRIKFLSQTDDFLLIFKDFTISI